MKKTNDYELVARAINYLDQHFKEQPALNDVADAVGLSQFHFQRLFRRWAGISPKRFLQFLTAEHVRSQLEESRDILTAGYEAGLSGPGRLHDLCVNIFAATPAQVRDAGANLTIRHGRAATPLGECLVGSSDRGIVALEFVSDGQVENALAELKYQWQSATFVEEDAEAREVVTRVFGVDRESNGPPITLYVQGSNFQIRVWEALLRIPFGNTVTYSDLAQAIGRPRAVRAVASAVAGNPAGFIIPCHRVILKSGAFGGYRWGKVRKRALLAWEAARTREGQ